MANTVTSYFSIVPADVIGLFCTTLSIRDLGRLSTIDKRLRKIVLDILVRRLQLSFDLPPEMPLGLALKVTIIHLRQFFQPYRVRNASLPAQELSLQPLLGFEPDLTHCKIKLYQATALRHLGLLRYVLSRTYQEELPPSSSALDKQAFLTKAYERACQSKHFRMALEILQVLRESGSFLRPSNEFLVTAVRSGDLDMVQTVESMTDPANLDRLYHESPELLLKEACKSAKINIVAHVSRKVGRPILLPSDVIQAAYSTEIVNILNLIFHLATPESAPAALRGAYLSKRISSVEDSIQRFKLVPSPDPKELSYACSTSDLAMVEFALQRIDPKKCDIVEASKQACTFYHLPILTLLVENKLFDLGNNYIDSLETLFKNARNKGELEQLLNLIEALEDKAYIVSTPLYINAAEQSKKENFKKDQAEKQAHTLLEQHLLQAIKKGDLQEVKKISPEDAHIPEEVLDSFRLSVLFSATSEWGSKEHLDILLYLIKKGFKIVKDDGFPLNLHQIPAALQDIERFFLQACRHGHITAAQACLQEMARLPNADTYLMDLRKPEYQEAAILSGEPQMLKFLQEVQKMASFQQLPFIIKEIVDKNLSWMERLQSMGISIKLFFCAIVLRLVALWSFLKNLVH